MLNDARVESCIKILKTLNADCNLQMMQKSKIRVFLIFSIEHNSFITL